MPANGERFSVRQRNAWRQEPKTQPPTRPQPAPVVVVRRDHERYRWMIAQLILATIALGAFGAAAADPSTTLMEEGPRPAEATWTALRVGYVPRSVLDLELEPSKTGTDVAIEARGSQGTIVIDGGSNKLVGLRFHIVDPSGTETLVLRAKDGGQWTVWSDGAPRSTSPELPPGTVRVPVGGYELLGWSRDGMATDMTLNVAVVSLREPPVVIESGDLGKIAAMALGTGALVFAGLIRWSPTARARVKVAAVRSMALVRRPRAQRLDPEAGDG